MIALDKKAAAKKFADYWKGRGYEKGESQTFWNDLLQKKPSAVFAAGGTCYLHFLLTAKSIFPAVNITAAAMAKTSAKVLIS